MFFIRGVKTWFITIWRISARASYGAGDWEGFKFFICVLRYYFCTNVQSLCNLANKLGNLANNLANLIDLMERGG
jgi:hypothetical protein